MTDRTPSQPRTPARKAGVLDLRKWMRPRDRLSAGERWIRTVGPRLSSATSMSRERVLVAVKMTFRGDDLTTPATPDTSQAPQHGFPGSHPYTCVGPWAGLVGWITGRLMVAGLSPINSRKLPIIVGRCSPSLQPKRQAIWWRLQRSQPQSSLSVTEWDVSRVKRGTSKLRPMASLHGSVVLVAPT